MTRSMSLTRHAAVAFAVLASFLIAVSPVAAAPDPPSALLDEAAPTVVALGVSQLDAGVSTHVTIEVTSPSGVPTGSVELFADGSSVGSAPVVAGAATFMYLPDAGAVELAAEFTPDSADFTASSAVVVEAFHRVDTTVDWETEYTAPTSPSSTGSLTGRMCVVPANAALDPTHLGSVPFEISTSYNGFVLDTGLRGLTLVDGCWGILTTDEGQNLPPGEFILAVDFAGSEYLAATVSTFAFTVLEAPTTLAVDATGDPDDPLGRSTELTASLSPAVPGYIQRGDITFSVDGVHVATVPVVGGVARVIAGLDLGGHEVTAVYSGDGVHAAANGAPLTFDVAGPPLQPPTPPGGPGSPPAQPPTPSAQPGTPGTVVEPLAPSSAAAVGDRTAPMPAAAGALSLTGSNTAVLVLIGSALLAAGVVLTHRQRQLNGS